MSAVAQEKGLVVDTKVKNYEITHESVKYGPDERNVMDVWLAESDKLTPCVINIHGGGWLTGDKKRLSIPGGVKALLRENISVVSISYRYVKQTIIDSGSTRGTGPVQPRGDYPEPPVKLPLMDAARALQFVRSNAKEWNIDPDRIALTGGSAGACSSLWLAFHDDLADPTSDDPVLRESSKPYCVAVEAPQTTLDPKQILELMPNATYGGHAFGFVWDKSDPTVEIRSFLKGRDGVMAWIQEYSPYELVTKDDPPVYLFYKNDPDIGGNPKDPTHSANYGVFLKEKADKLGLKCELVHKGVNDPKHKNTVAYLIDMLRK